MSSKANVLRWVKRSVLEDGGHATFVGFGRIARRTLGKVQAMLPDGYETMLFDYRSDPESNPFRHSRHEVRLRVTHKDAPWPVQAIHPIYSPPEDQSGNAPGRSEGTAS
jgi:hypothetical protein